MSILLLVFAVAALILLITVIKLHPFLAFLIVCIFTGLSKSMEAAKLIASIQKGIGDIMGSLLVILILGAMLGKLVADSGAANKIAQALIQAFGTKYIQWALVLTAFIVGIPLFYGVGFVLLVPLVIGIAAKYKLPAVYLGLPTLAALSVTHGYLPPHPSPVALSEQFHADLGTTLFYGILIAIPAIIIAGPIFSVTLKKYTNAPLAIFSNKEIPDGQLPSLFASLMAAFLPVLLIGLDTLVNIWIPEKNGFTSLVHTLGDPSIAMLISLLIALYTLGIKQGKTIAAMMGPMGDAVKDISSILLIIGGAGALKQVLMDAGISQDLVQPLVGLSIHPLLLAWGISAIIRVSVGSATVAGLTTAGIVAPLIATTGVNPSLMVLATGAGSLMFSHVNDPGFWMFKEYFNLSVKDTIRTWSIMETIVSVAGLIGVLIINYFM
ncbi:MAG: gluconate transporter [Bacteroidetes bacterium 24-39-8]|nr:MAG: gluconate transporter [Bacteroidetes bacterium 24-39-8]OZA66845.1 MAG: gluconate transporter [Sphingobacteriia bacterium 39-39-8]HQR92951.1 gluconate:H+ symporter [Sediminibacterium sp.]HQS53925.1 gluconate:H+ symporter [Sediminibacterium sp.]